MKVCNLGTVTHLEDIMQMSDYICTEAHLLIIVPAFDRIKRSLKKFPFICSVPNRKRLHKPSCIWKSTAWKLFPDSCPIMVLPLSLPKHVSHPLPAYPATGKQHVQPVRRTQITHFGRIHFFGTDSRLFKKPTHWCHCSRCCHTDAPGCWRKTWFRNNLPAGTSFCANSTSRSLCHPVACMPGMLTVK